MFESSKQFHCRRILLRAALCFAAATANAATAERGQYGGDLNFLQRYYTAPQVPGESNHYIDLWAPGSLPALARVNGLTNNHALFVDSHAKAGCAMTGSGYGLYPNEDLLRPGQETPYFSARDVATVLGLESAASIHNVVIAGCNLERRFNSQEVRRNFPNATNITYMAAGYLAFKPMFYQAIALPSSEIKPLYGKTVTRGSRVECDIVDGPGHGAKQLGAYMADLYLPGAKKPFRTQPAGRELLDPSLTPPPAMSAEFAFPETTPAARTANPEEAPEVSPSASPRKVPPIIILRENPAQENPNPAATPSAWQRVRDALFQYVNARSVH